MVKDNTKKSIKILTMILIGMVLLLSSFAKKPALAKEVAPSSPQAVVLATAEQPAADEATQKRIDELIKQLGSRNGSTLSSAVNSLVRIGKPAVQPLIKALGDQDAQVQARFSHERVVLHSWIIVILGQIGDAQAVPRLIKALGDRDQQVRTHAAKALGKIGDPRAVQPLKEAMGNKAIGDKNATFRQIIIMALGEIGDTRAVQFIINELGNEERLIRYQAIIQLGKIGDIQAVQPLIEVLEEVLEDEDVQVGVIAARALGKIGDTQAVQPLIKALGYKFISIPCSAARALGEIGDTQAVQPLIKALEDKSELVRQNVAKSLGEIGDLRAVQPLTKALEDSDPQVRGLAAAALEQIKSKVTPEEWAKVIGEKEPAEVKEEQALQTKILATAAQPAADEATQKKIDELIKQLGSNNRNNAVISLVKFGKPAVQSLIEALGDENMDVRRWAALALGEIGEPRAVQPLIKVLG
ncbi:MAG: HEAT repeat domain-containing protein, partial [Planctomycetota bacterium]